MTTSLSLPKLSPEQKFMGSVLVVNAGNYIYNLALGRILGPELFADAALLITLLLVLSFVAMTFQLTTAKFSVLLETNMLKSFVYQSYRYATYAGVVMGALLIFFARELQSMFQTQSHWMFIIFGFGIPVYFLMSINRGIFQGTKKFDKLAITYQGEMISRLVFTLLLIYLLPFSSSIAISLGVVISLIFGLFPITINKKEILKKQPISAEYSKPVLRFFILTACYELSQIIINNSDILIVKHYFEEQEAGLYASLALIGRVVYFIAWMFVMLLLPKVVQKQKEGDETSSILFTYVAYISIFATAIILGCYVFPELIIQLLFGHEYLSIAPLLYTYAIATSLFAVSNIFAYYFLSLDNYIPLLLSGLLGMTQVILIVWFHDSLTEVVFMQIGSMLVLLLVQIIYFITYRYSWNKRKKSKLE